MVYKPLLPVFQLAYSARRKGFDPSASRAGQHFSTSAFQLVPGRLTSGGRRPMRADLLKCEVSGRVRILPETAISRFPT